jgi:hypothetical protein
VYDRDGASDVICRSIEDYRATYGEPETRIAQLRRLLSDSASLRGDQQGE